MQIRAATSLKCLIAASITKPVLGRGEDVGASAKARRVESKLGDDRERKRHRPSAGIGLWRSLVKPAGDLDDVIGDKQPTAMKVEINSRMAKAALGGSASSAR